MTPFDRLSPSYDELLRDPIRDRFTGRQQGYFHRRKADLIRQFFQRRSVETAGLDYLDVGCGKGELLGLLARDFRQVAGCDVSNGMMREIAGIEIRVQSSPLQVPFGDAEFDLVTAVCVYHHVLPAFRAKLTAEIGRVLRPGGIFCVMEHNPWNPVTRLIVSRTPVDTDAALLRAPEARKIAIGAGLTPFEQQYFLYLPQGLYRYAGFLERALTKVPLGGQYAVFSRKPH